MLAVIKVVIEGMAQMNEMSLPIILKVLSHTFILTVLSIAFRKFLSKINVSNAFKTLSTSDSNVFFLRFETEINRIPSSHRKAVVIL